MLKSTVPPRFAMNLIAMKTRLFTLIAAISLALPTLAADDAAGSDTDSHDPMHLVTLEMVWAVILFLAFAGVLGFKVWPKILGALQAREEKLEGDLVGAEEARVEHEKLVAEYKGKLAEAQKEYQKVIDEARQDAQKIASGLKADTEKEIADLKTRAEADINAAKQQALSEIYAQTAALSTEIAGKILSREVSADEHQALIQESLAKLN